VAPYARLVTHVLGEHLGEWERGVRMLDTLRAAPACSSDEAAVAIRRGIASLRYAGGAQDAVAGLPGEDAVAALATAASALAGRNEFTRALATYHEATRVAPPDLPAKSPAIRALAIAGNNLACALEEKTDRDGLQTDGMVQAARAALRYWKQAGTWLEEERAEYRLANSLLQADDAAAAVQSAQRCADVCIANAAPPFELFFARAALALARRAAGDLDGFVVSRREARALYETIPDQERKWCNAELKRLEDGGNDQRDMA